MGFNKENFRRIKEEYSQKYRLAEEAAEAKRAALEEKIPGLALLDQRLSGTGLRLMEGALGDPETFRARVEETKAENQRIQAERAELLKAYGYPEDYLAVKYECPLCRDTGYIGYKMCRCMRERLVLAGFESSGISELLATQSFESFDVEIYRRSPEDYERMKTNLQAAKDFAENCGEGEPENLLLVGGTGLGKTHLTSAIARRVIERGYDVKYVTAVGMLSDFEFQRFGNNVTGESGADLSVYYDCDLLLIDDLGTEVNNQFTVSCLYHVINQRLNRRLPTVISTNLKQAELRQRYWDRITSRLFGEYRPLLFVGTDYRARKLRR